MLIQRRAWVFGRAVGAVLCALAVDGLRAIAPGETCGMNGSRLRCGCPGMPRLQAVGAARKTEFCRTV